MAEREKLLRWGGMPEPAEENERGATGRANIAKKPWDESPFWALLRHIRQQPALYIGRPSLENLAVFLTAYFFAHHQARSLGSSQEGEYRGLCRWIRRKYPAADHPRWDQIIRAVAGSDSGAFDKFFELMDEYRTQEEGPDSSTPKAE